MSKNIISLFMMLFISVICFASASDVKKSVKLPLGYLMVVEAQYNRFPLQLIIPIEGIITESSITEFFSKIKRNWQLENIQVRRNGCILFEKCAQEQFTLYVVKPTDVIDVRTGLVMNMRNTLDKLKAEHYSCMSLRNVMPVEGQMVPFFDQEAITAAIEKREAFPVV